jgi:hypothetical protein
VYRCREVDASRRLSPHPPPDDADATGALMTMSLLGLQVLTEV